MKRSFDRELQGLKHAILQMGELVEKAIEEALDGLKQRDGKHFDRVYNLEKIINGMHMSIDESCVRALALHSPVAADLRLVVSIIKINTDLERMGDQAVNISHNASRYIAEPPLKPLVDLPVMATEVRIMVRESLDAFLKPDLALARTVLGRDDTVDELKNKIFDEVVDSYMMVDPTSVHRGLDLILIARNLERIGDHATNIAEDAIYVASGEDVRHGKRTQPPASAVSKTDRHN